VTRLAAAAQQLFNQLVSTLGSLPTSMRLFFHQMHYALRTHGFPAAFARDVSVGLFFRRFVCIALLLPHVADLCSSPPSEEAETVLLFLARIIMATAEQVDFGNTDEPFMLEFNALVEANKRSVQRLCENLPATGDVVAVSQTVFATMNTNSGSDDLRMTGSGSMLLHESHVEDMLRTSKKKNETQQALHGVFDALSCRASAVMDAAQEIVRRGTRESSSVDSEDVRALSRFVCGALWRRLGQVCDTGGPSCVCTRCSHVR
jgi:hypothetical protein